MDPIVFLTPTFAVTTALRPADLAEAARLGFRMVISNRPDGEAEGQLSSREEAVHAWRAGLKFRHVPAAKLDIFTDAVVESMVEAITSGEGPILAHCASGLRSAIAWAAASARTQPVDCVLGALEKAGFDLAFLRDDLEAQADRRRWLADVAPALDCAEAARLPARAAA